uniref:Uncharacterized protein n=1 Tax=Trichogramma kaykai TaxID=54128 RepID=A0ABD2WUH5_9HYME
MADQGNYQRQRPQQEDEWQNLNAPHFHAEPRVRRNRAEKRRARKNRQRLQGRGRPQNHLPKEAGPPTPNQPPANQDNAWLAEFVRNREETRSAREEEARRRGAVVLNINA